MLRSRMRKKKDSVETPAEKLAHNVADVLKHGPRLAYSRKTWISAVSPDGAHVLLNGLGAMGVGQMWVRTSDEIRQNEEYDKAPRIRPEDSVVGRFGLDPVPPLPEELQNGGIKTQEKG